MKVIFNDTTIAEADKEDLIRIEGNWYFPPESIKREYFTDSDHKTTCFWKGESSYYDVEANGESMKNGAWYYPTPMDGSVERVKKDFTNYVAFYSPAISVTE